MSGYGLFQAPTLGMQSQSHKLNTIGYNIANINTGGFKRTDTHFQTVLSDTIDTQSDYGGVKPFSRATNDVQGLIQSTGGKLDLAISGQGFFGVQSSLTQPSAEYYTRDGMFQVNTVEGQTSTVTADDGAQITVSNGYLVDKNGYFLRGVPINSDGTFSTGEAAPMRVDQYAFADQGQPTSAASLELNLPSGHEVADGVLTQALRVYDSSAAERNISFDFKRRTENNQWTLTARADNLSSSTFTPSTDTLNFSSRGRLETPTEATFDATWSDGSTSSFTIDLSKMTQFNGDFTAYRTAQDGLGLSEITDVSLDGIGRVVGTFADGTTRSLYKIPLYDFSNPNALKSKNGMVFSETEGSGAPINFFADESSKGGLNAGAAEKSNVDVAQEFSQMIQAQTAYNMSATTFRTIDEMTTVARDLKA